MAHPRNVSTHSHLPHLAHLTQKPTSGIRTPDRSHLSPADVDGDEDDDADSIPDIPLRSLASRLDVARLVADGHVVQEEDDMGRHRRHRRDSSLDRAPGGAPGSAGAGEQWRKRARLDEQANHLRSVREGTNLRASGVAADSPEGHATNASVPRPKGDLARTFGDPVDMGICTDEEGRKLVEL